MDMEMQTLFLSYVTYVDGLQHPKDVHYTTHDIKNPIRHDFVRLAHDDDVRYFKIDI